MAKTGKAKDHLETLNALLFLVGWQEQLIRHALGMKKRAGSIASPITKSRKRQGGTAGKS